MENVMEDKTVVGEKGVPSSHSSKRLATKSSTFLHRKYCKGSAREIPSSRRQAGSQIILLVTLAYPRALQNRPQK